MVCGVQCLITGCEEHDGPLEPYYGLTWEDNEYPFTAGTGQFRYQCTKCGKIGYLCRNRLRGFVVK